jgi:hypothetical protein
MAPSCTDEEFREIWESTGGSAAEVARILRVSQRNVYKRRRSLEEKDRRPLLNKTAPHSLDAGIVLEEFPDWQHLEVKNGTVVGFSDSHLVPQRKSTAHHALLKLLHEIQPVAVVEMGDLVDLAAVSRHHRIGWDRQVSVKEELQWAADCVAEIRLAAGKKAKTFKTQGNHDQRFSGHLSNNLAPYEGVPGFSLADHIKDWPVSWCVRVNETELEITHRWKSGIHAPWNNVMNAGISYATGHLHSQKVYPLTDLRGDRWGVDVGTLSPVYGPYFRYLEGKPRNWRSGFAVFRFVNYKLRQPQLVRVVDEEKRIVEYLGRDISV